MKAEDIKKALKEFDEVIKEDITMTDDDMARLEEVMNRTPKNYLDIGVHRVNITKVSPVVANSGTAGIEFTVENADGESTATCWITPKTLPYVVARISRILVHNKPESEKTAAKAKMKEIKSARNLYAVCSGLIGKECWLQISEANTTYVNKNGETKYNLNREIDGYEMKPKAPKPQLEQVAQAVGGEKTDIDLNDIPF